MTRAIGNIPKQQKTKKHLGKFKKDLSTFFPIRIICKE